MQAQGKFPLGSWIKSSLEELGERTWQILGTECWLFVIALEEFEERV